MSLTRLIATLAAMLLLAGLALAGPMESAVKVLGMRADCWSGSGVAVSATPDATIILTNRHIAPDRDGSYRIVFGGRSAAARWIAADEVADLAVLEAPVSLPAVSFAVTEPPANVPLRLFSFPGGRAATMKSGLAFGYLGIRDDHGASVYEAGFTPEGGDSGGGVYDPTDKLVAICYGRSNATGRAHMVGLADIKRFLKGR